MMFPDCFDEDRNTAHASSITKCINLPNMLNVYVYQCI